ncbi:hypothetical protein CHGG_10495 [Chaetomium globosum CBS 148.51]|uniref:DUF8212 domain-containing protein n=1 Tax=Chaetomium globosum (strain ATCC 6205 / CBS 148.51 / DSM 1962 / NBRC 6347 / NRRL 1970) TaxID=306901 RepID=Q2GNF9_CHAGB|nr:uncharacterized protein CHGG_10495 [Chaetomium globosum CBS 148.51]EAQ84091.1 hypothetical protein CHGG_10495 [Chaetomium globosum CBS 148.51]
MALIYGEGANAFIRLQEEIIKRTNDLSILAWDSRERCRIGPYCGILAASPADFIHASRNFSTTSWSFMTEFTITNSGLRITTKLWVPWVPPSPTSFAPDHTGYLLCLSDSRRFPLVGIHLKMVG